MELTSRQRLMRTMRGEAVDRVPVSFYEIGSAEADPGDPDPFNIYNDPSWTPLLELAEQTDVIRMRSPVRAQSHVCWGEKGGKGAGAEYIQMEHQKKDGVLRICKTIRIGGRELRKVQERRAEVNTVWTVEHLLKSREDAEAYLQLPDEVFAEVLDIGRLERAEAELGEGGIVMVDTEDPICAVAELFSMEDFTIFAMTENALMHRLLEKHAKYIHARTEATSRAFPGRLWRIYGPEFATEPYMPPRLFEEYVVRYTGPMVKMIQKYGGWARIHAHGRIRNVLGLIAGMGADGLDPIEPPPQGDVEMAWVRKEFGEQMSLFGNIEVSDIETKGSEKFREIVRRSLEDGTRGEGRGFVLMPSASPYGRTITKQVLENYRILLELGREWRY